MTTFNVKQKCAIKRYVLMRKVGFLVRRTARRTKSLRPGNLHDRGLWFWRCLLALAERVAGYAVEGQKAFEFGDQYAGDADSLQKVDRLLLADLGLALEAGDPTVDRDRILKAVWPDLCAAITDREQLEPVARRPTDFSRQRGRIGAGVKRNSKSAGNRSNANLFPAGWREAA